MRRADSPGAYNLSTSWGLSHYEDLAEFARDAQAWGFAGVEANYGVSLDGLARLQRSGVPISSIHFPGPLVIVGTGTPEYAGPLVPGEQGRREAALRHAVRTIGEAAGCGAGAVVFHAADLPQLRDLETRLADLCGRMDAAANERKAAREQLLDARRALAPPLLEAVAAALEPLLPAAEQHGVRLALETRADARDLPSREEMRQLLSCFPSRSLGYWHDTGHAFRQELLGFGPAQEWLTSFNARVTGMHLSDCRGLDDHYPPGQGEVDFRATLALRRPDTVLTVELAGRHSPAEVRAGLEHLRTCESMR